MFAFVSGLTLEKSAKVACIDQTPYGSLATLRGASGSSFGSVRVMKSLLNAVSLGLVVIALSACGGMPGPAPWSDSAANRLELGSGVVAAFVEGLTPEMPGRVAYITHVASGSQAILDSEGKVVQRHDGRADGASRWIQFSVTGPQWLSSCSA